MFNLFKKYDYCVEVVTAEPKKIENEITDWLEGNLRHKDMEVLSISHSTEIENGKSIVRAIILYREPRRT